MSTQPRWWSCSRKEWQDIATLAPGHLHNALARLVRGEYVPEGGEPLTDDDRFLLEQALRTEIEAREQERSGEVPGA